MCNIHLLKPIKRAIDAQDCEFMRYMLLEGAQNNKDDWGLSNGLITRAERGQYKGARFPEFNGSPYLIGHNRLATQGLTSQPVTLEGWTIAHNGIFSGDYSEAKAEKSDSLKWLESFTAYAKGKKHSVKALAKFLSKTTGSYSLFLISPDGRLYYAKSDYTKMTFKLLRDGDSYLIAASTDEENIKGYFQKSLLGFPIAGRKHFISTLKPDSFTIYEISDAGVNPIKRYNAPAPITTKYVSVFENDGELTDYEKAQAIQRKMLYGEGYQYMRGNLYDY